MSIDSVRADERGRVTLPGRKNQHFMVTENEDGSLLLQPASLVSDAQRAYDNSPELQEMLHRAMTASTVRRPRRQPRTA